MLTSRAVVVMKHSAETLASADRARVSKTADAGVDESIFQALVIALGMVMLDIFAQRSPQRALAEQNQRGQALLLHRPDPALRIGIEVGAARGQHQRLDLT